MPSHTSDMQEIEQKYQERLGSMIEPYPQSNSVVVQLTDGLGNQMFQYAFALALQRVGNKPVMLDVSWFPEFGGKLNKATFRNYGMTPFKLSLHYTPFGYAHNMVYGKGWFGQLMKRWHIRRHFVREKKLDCALANLVRVPQPLVVRGFFQREEYARSVRHLLLDEFTVDESTLDSANKAMLAAIRAAGNRAVMVHIRRGDYLNPGVAQVHGTCSAEYYRKAEQYIAEKTGDRLHLFLFSDDPEWVLENYKTENDITVVNINSADAGHLDINLMRHCAHAITANSTFSWWGAWLINSPERVVVAPATWFADGRSVAGLLPEDWKTI